MCSATSVHTATSNFRCSASGKRRSCCLSLDRNTPLERHASMPGDAASTATKSAPFIPFDASDASEEEDSVGTAGVFVLEVADEIIAASCSVAKQLAEPNSRKEWQGRPRSAAQ